MREKQWPTIFWGGSPFALVQWKPSESTVHSVKFISGESKAEATYFTKFNCCLEKMGSLKKRNWLYLFWSYTFWLHDEFHCHQGIQRFVVQITLLLMSLRLAVWRGISHERAPPVWPWAVISFQACSVRSIVHPRFIQGIHSLLGQKETLAALCGQKTAIKGRERNICFQGSWEQVAGLISRCPHFEESKPSGYVEVVVHFKPCLKTAQRHTGLHPGHGQSSLGPTN